MVPVSAPEVLAVARASAPSLRPRPARLHRQTRTAGVDKYAADRALCGWSAATAFDGFLRGERGQDREIAGAGEECQELLNRVQAGSLDHEQQHMLDTDKCLGLDGDAVAGGDGR